MLLKYMQTPTMFGLLGAPRGETVSILFGCTIISRKLLYRERAGYLRISNSGFERSNMHSKGYFLLTVRMNMLQKCIASAST